MVWLSMTTYTPSRQRRRLRPPLLRNMRLSLRWLPSRVPSAGSGRERDPIWDMGIDCWVDMVTEKAKVRSEQKTYDKNNMLTRKAKDIRAKFARM